MLCSIKQCCLWAVLLGALLVSAQNNFLLFHSVAEMFSVVIALAIFMIARNARHFLGNDLLPFLGITYLFVGMFDAVHLLSYKGMGVFPNVSTEVSIQVWIVARYMECLSLAFAAYFAKHRMPEGTVFLAYSCISLFLISSIFIWQVFPTCYVDGVGLTAFKKNSEYIIATVLLGCAIYWAGNRKLFDDSVYTLLVASMVVTVVSELFFTLYVDVYGLFNIRGYFLKIVSFLFIYNAIIESGLIKPYTLFFHDVK